MQQADWLCLTDLDTGGDLYVRVGSIDALRAARPGMTMLQLRGETIAVRESPAVIFERSAEAGHSPAPA